MKLLADTLQDDHDIRPQVTTQIMGWFGDVGEYYWRMDVPSVLKQVGVGILRTFRVSCFLLRGSLKSLTNYKHDPVDENEFLDKWRNAVGDTFASQTDLSLLSVRLLRGLLQFLPLIAANRETILHRPSHNHTPLQTSCHTSRHLSCH